jgi:hypothetical protein
MLTEGLNRLERQRRVISGEVRAAGTGGARGEGCCRGPSASDHHGSARGVPAQVLRGLRRSGNHRWQGIEAAELLTGGDPRCDSGHCTMNFNSWYNLIRLNAN